MPELAGVDTFRRFLNRTAIGQTIEKIDVRDEMILRGLSARTLQCAGPRKGDSEVRQGINSSVSSDNEIVFILTKTGEIALCTKEFLYF